MVFVLDLMMVFIFEYETLEYERSTSFPVLCRCRNYERHKYFFNFLFCSPLNNSDQATEIFKGFF